MGQLSDEMAGFFVPLFRSLTVFKVANGDIVEPKALG